MVRKPLRILLAGVLFSVAFSIGAAETVKEVKVRTLDQFGTDATDVLSYCSIVPGAELTQEALSKDVRALLDTGRFGYAGVEIQKLESGARVVFVVKRRYRFQEPLIVKGADALSFGKISNLTELKSGDYIDEPLLAERTALVRDAYLKKYYPDVKVVAEIQPIKGSVGSAHVALTITEGPRIKIKEYAFEGNTSIPAKELRASFGQRPWYDPRGWFSDAPVSAQDLEDARSLAEQVYQDHGYLDAKVAPAERKELGDGTANMVFKVTEGDQYTVESTDIRGVKLFPEGEVLGQSPLKVDDVAGMAAIRATEKALSDYYGARGYVDTSVRTIRKAIPGKPGRMALTFDLKEGELAYIRNIIIRGNEKTQDKVIRREVLVSPGALMNTVQIERSERRLRNLGYFKEVRHYTEKPDKDGQRDLVYEVEEQGTGKFMMGAGFSSVDNLVGFVQVSQSNFDILNWPNFTGGGQKARLGVEVGSRRQTAEVAWTQPWLFDRPLSLTVELYRRMRWYDEYDEIRTGGSVGLSYPMREINLFGLKLGGHVGAKYTLEMVEMDDVEHGVWYTDPSGGSNGDWDDGWVDENGYATPATWKGDYFKWQEKEYGDNLNSVMRLYWANDTRNHPFVPTRGYQATLFGEASEGGLGDNEFYKVGINYKRWFELPWFKHVLSLRGRFETVDAYGDSDELPIYEHLFLGGPRTVRGVEFRDIGPKIFRGHGTDSHAPIGGRTLAMASIEYTIPIISAIRFATFMDVGSLGEDSFDPELSDISLTAGVGLRIDIPGFPIRLDFATPLSDDDDYTDDEVFSFVIGFE